MNATKQKDIQVRQFNAQCCYGPWISVTSTDLPQWVADLVLDEFAEMKEEGMVERGGSMWKFRTINS
jgi:hypothetical protein